MAHVKACALIADDGSGACTTLQANLRALGLAVNVVDGVDSGSPTDVFQKCHSAMLASKYAFLFVGAHLVLGSGRDFVSEMMKIRHTCSNAPAVIGFVASDQPTNTKQCME